MTGRGNGKYGYKEKNRREAEILLRDKMHKYFPNNRIEYVVQYLTLKQNNNIL